ncbi:C45 family autoproteolytic acyltransferase/hydolase [Natronoglycomyces albus]|uniref:Peptidase C45 hydrolase domain-containing protein n=1 Tax=Natronoglycomyces albus TaxID=2811108 RepID=A0A895XWR3_9ACTN|nr:C45 family peptidase [Natronoglycomyces albus]QSB06660.1 hypothetical protein JQS30_07125 [Natronoglycomyces albus]
MTSLPLLNLDGSPYRQGLQHGERLAEEIAANIALYRNRMITAGLTEAQLTERAQVFLRRFTHYDASYRASMDGIAAGSKQSILDITLVNARYELLYSAWSEFGHPAVQYMKSHQPDLGECTSFGGAATTFSDVDVRIGQNWDWFLGAHCALLRWRKDNLTVLGFTEAGIVGPKLGMNSAGIGLGLNGLGCSADSWQEESVPVHLRTWRILRSTKPGEAIGHATTPRPTVSSNFFIGSTDGTVATVEASPRGCRVIYQDGTTPLVHANHFLHPEGLGVDQSWLKDTAGSTFHRQKRLQALLEETSPVTLEKLQASLRDHDGEALSVCRHPEQALPEEFRTHTAFSAILDLSAGRFHYTYGPPCESQYQILEV